MKQESFTGKSKPASQWNTYISWLICRKSWFQFSVWRMTFRPDGVSAFASVSRYRYPGYWVIHDYFTFAHFKIWLFSNYSTNRRQRY